MENKGETIVRKYYEFVDAKKFKEMLELFSDNTEYTRCERKITGKKDLEIFYKNERKLEGQHRIIEMVQKGSKIITEGVFTGKDKKLKFVDIFEISKDNKIEKRRTYLATGFEQTV